MSIEIIHGEIKRFLASPEAEVIAIKGRWGVGKTYSWNKFLADAQRDKKVGFNRYSYVTLFGVNSLESLKFSIFEQMVDAKLIGSTPSIETFKKNSLASLNTLGRRGLGFFSGLPKLKDFSQAINSISFLTVSRALICIDDLERRGDGLNLRDVLGLVSYLKENKQCKVVLLMNEGEKGLEDYEKFREKVVDVEMVFDPSSKECVEIAFDPENKDLVTLGKYAQILDIKNIRILKKIERLVLMAVPMLKEMDDEVVESAIRSLVLFSWCAYAPKPEAPPLDYALNSATHFLGLNSKAEIKDEEKRWISILRNYNFGFADELDRVLAGVVEKGILVQSELVQAALKTNQQLLDKRSSDSYYESWRLYHDSFDDNQERVIDALCEGIKKHVKHVSISNLNVTVHLLKVLDEREKATEIIHFYLKERLLNQSDFDINREHLFGDPLDDELRQKCENLQSETAVQHTPAEVLNMVSTHSWNPEDEEVLAKLSVDDFYELFKSSTGEDLQKLVNGALFLGRLSNADPRQKDIGLKAERALKRIADENPLNRVRVKKYGVSV